MSFLVSEADPIRYEDSCTLVNEQTECEPTPKQPVVEENYVENTTTNITAKLSGMSTQANKSAKNTLPLLFLGGALLVILAMQK